MTGKTGPAKQGAKKVQKQSGLHEIFNARKPKVGERFFPRDCTLNSRERGYASSPTMPDIKQKFLFGDGSSS